MGLEAEDGFLLYRSVYMDEREKDKGIEYQNYWWMLIEYERKRQKVSYRSLTAGILWRKSLEAYKNGKSSWSSLAENTMMQRLGISTEHMEFIAADKELEHYKLREKICYNLLESPEIAEQAIIEYEGKENLSSVEIQFIKKMRAILCIKQQNDLRKALQHAKAAVSCTVDNWEQDLDKSLLAPAELEALLMVSEIFFRMDQLEDAWRLARFVWEYPEKHHWEVRMKALIMPQTALVGARIKLQQNKGKRAFYMVQEAIEILRQINFHRYLLPLLELIIEINSEDERAYLEDMVEFRDAIIGLYKNYNIPLYRTWQTVSYANTYVVSSFIKNLRKATGLSQERAGEEILEAVQFSRIENGHHRPKQENYTQLVRRFGKDGELKQFLLVTDQVDVLFLSRQIRQYIYECEWREAERCLELLEEKLDMSILINKQLYLYYYCVINYVMKRELPEVILEKCYQALECSVQMDSIKNLEYYVFNRTESMILNTIAIILAEKASIDRAIEYYEMLINSAEKLIDENGVSHIGYFVWLRGYTNCLGDIGMNDKAMELDQRGIELLLKGEDLGNIDQLLYDFVWNTEEKMKENLTKATRHKVRWWFHISQVFAKYSYARESIDFLNEKASQYT